MNSSSQLTSFSSVDKEPSVQRQLQISSCKSSVASDPRTVVAPLSLSPQP
ncbi:hypothetical protein LINPERPRIM_LOCUS27303 [Linum perenne]